ncbi:DUF6445 family protein [Rivibacter subsaxonicus]|uniref:Uncharacterized protein n=1 Tax=Rivibacter subsaxonicus TaxID=457575 RepID=A0A4Q7V5S5_9BURK|nr:DUF6445 family protein [Rivibacter subsaxonicus]RZT91896.1 hypothetical protein EV670_3568 [Rivibacter subsaxonicus]
MSPPVAIRMPPDVRSVNIGGQNIVFIDNFLQDPQALVEAACQSRFEPSATRAEGKGYPGLRAAAPAAYTQALTELLDPLIRINFQVPEQLDIKVGLSAFSLTTTQPEELGPLQRTPHFDASTPHYMAALLYLCDESHGGTGFYRHNATGLQRITAEDRERYLDVYHAEVKRRTPPARYFDRSDEQFSFLGMMPARFNRLVVYPGSLLHSACINPARSLSSDPRQGRLTVNTFYDL